MNKFIYLIGLMLLSFNMMAQIGDVENWDIFINEEFAGNRDWDTNTFKEQSSDTGFTQRWDCMTAEWCPYYITTDEHSHQAYQPSHARFGKDKKMRLVAECVSPLTPLVCANDDYLLPQNAYCSFTYNGHYYPPPPAIFYYSGTIETTQFDCWFGYYEIKCRLPVHPGEGAAFWLFGTGPNTYEEIDIFEHSLVDSQATNNMATGFSCGIWYNPNGTNYNSNDHNSGADNYCKKFLAVSTANDLTHNHVFGMEWLPDRITWYFDGQVVNECTDREVIPQHPLRLKVTHDVKHDVIDEDSKLPIWTGTDEMVIDYVRYYKMRTDCETDAVIANVSDWNNTIGMKKTITIESAGGLVVPINSNKCLRASESITISGNGEFIIPLGAQATLITHDALTMKNTVSNYSKLSYIYLIVTVI